MKPEQTGLVVLAAGDSDRFGAADKLLAQISGGSVLSVMASSLIDIHFKHKVMVIGCDPVGKPWDDFAGFNFVQNLESGALGRSVALGVAALNPDCQAVVLALGDMPFVHRSTYVKLCEACTDLDSIVVSKCSTALGPPTAFGRQHFDRLMKLDGIRGAAQIWSGHPDLKIVVIDDPEARDIDTQDDLDTCP